MENDLFFRDVQPGFQPLVDVVQIYVLVVIFWTFKSVLADHDKSCVVAASNTHVVYVHEPQGKLGYYQWICRRFHSP